MINERKAVLDDPPRVEVDRWAITKMAFSTLMEPIFNVSRIHEVGPYPSGPPTQTSVKLDCAWVPPDSVKMTCATEEDARIWVAEEAVVRVSDWLKQERARHRDTRKKLRAALDLIATFKETVKDVREFSVETPEAES